MTLPGTPPVATDLVHHIGIAVANLDESIEFYRGLFGFKPGEIIVREDIGVRGCFVPVGETNLELLEGTSPDSLITTHIASRGEGLHHVCFEVEEIADKLKTLDELGIEVEEIADKLKTLDSHDRQGAPHRPYGRRYRIHAPFGSPRRTHRIGPAWALVLGQTWSGR